MKKIGFLLLILLTILSHPGIAGPNQSSDLLTGVSRTSAPTAVSDGQPVAVNLNTYGKIRTSVGKVCTKVINAVQLDDSPTTTTSSAVDITDSSDVSLMVSVAETDPGGTVDPQATVSVDVSPDNSNWLTTFDVLFEGGGTDAPVSSFTKNPGTGNTLYDWAYMPKEFPVNYMRVKIDCSATVGGSATCDADELLVVNAWVCQS